MEISEALADLILEGFSFEELNQEIYEKVKEIEKFILWHYQYGSKFDTPFWDYAKKISYDRLNNDLRWQYQINQIKMTKNQNFHTMRNHGVGVLPVKSWVDFDENLNYNLF